MKDGNFNKYIKKCNNYLSKIIYLNVYLNQILKICYSRTN